MVRKMKTVGLPNNSEETYTVLQMYSITMYSIRTLLFHLNSVESFLAFLHLT